MKPKIGIMGSANERRTGGVISSKAKRLAYELGKEIARHNCILINGACSGIPEESAKGAKENDGFVIGVSPAKDMEEHARRYKFPVRHYDVIIYTGFGFKGRNVVNVSNCDAVIIVAGRVGTLNEFTIAYDEGKVIGVMQGSGGIADFVRRIIQVANKRTGARVFYDSDPHRLVKTLLVEVQRRRRSKRIE
ncbi:MAG: LOG family protein [Candidatus Aenigmarchaeota archaeon]|nr:LOG family protein [Candidatus Aenigmarchaeota archaeon]